MSHFRIDIVSDVVCPWCIIGYKQLEQALEPFADKLTLEINWHPFELNPKMPAEGQNLGEHLAEKYGTTPEQSVAARESLTSLGKALGFEFNYFDEMRVVNTFKAHQLLFWAAPGGKQTALKLRLFAAFFSEGLDVNTDDVLLQCVEEVGLDRDEAAIVLRDEPFAESVREHQKLWLDQGINAVPAFILNRSYLLSGAQPVDVFTTHIQKCLNPPA